MTEGSSRAEWLTRARAYLRSADPVLAGLIDDRPAFDPRAWMTQLPPMDLATSYLFSAAFEPAEAPPTAETTPRKVKQG